MMEDESVDTAKEEVIPLNKLAGIYLKIRNKMQELEKQHEAALAVLEEQRDEVANAMKEQLLASGS
jgi:hypothetical protein